MKFFEITATSEKKEEFVTYVKFNNETGHKLRRNAVIATIKDLLTPKIGPISSVLYDKDLELWEVYQYVNKDCYKVTEI